jgi:hypothetical protein
MNCKKRNIRIALFFMFCILANFSSASDLMDVMPVTNKILCLYFVDGHVDYGTYGSQATSSKAYQNPLNTAQVSSLTNYSITSPDDQNYASLTHPINAGRKSRGKDYVSMFAQTKYVLEHFVYIELPSVLQNGKRYKLSLNNLNVDNVKETEFVFNDRTMRSPAVHVNQVGYAPTGAKIAYVSQWMGDFNTALDANGGLNLDSFVGAPVHVIRVADGAIVFTGALAKRLSKSTAESQSADFPIKNFSNTDVWECDFSTFAVPGTYTISVEGIGCSFPFAINADIYRQAYYDVSKALFTQRQGINKELEGGVIYPRDHHPDDGDVFYTGTTTKVNLWGWYHDAGDWDGYNDHVHIPIDLLLLYDLQPDHFADGDIGNRYQLSDSSPWIEEGKNGIPDILDEAKWLVSFYRRGKEALIAVGKGDGGVPSGNIGPDAGCENRASWTDTRATYVGAQNALTTFSYAAAAAYYSICLQKFYGTSNIETLEWLDQAIAAWDWAFANDSVNHDEKMLAAVLLYRATGEAKYQTQFINSYSSSMNGDYWGAPDLPQYAIVIYSLLPASTPGLNATLQTSIKNKVIQNADTYFVNPGKKNSFRLPLVEYRSSILGIFSTPRVLFLAAAHELTHDAKYVDSIYHFANYTLGGNQNNMVYVGQLGWNPDNNTFHPDSWRFGYHHKVYTTPSLPGYVNYWGMTDGDWFDGTSYGFDGDEDWSRSTAYPSIRQWPGSEWRMNNRFSIAGSEFTIHQNFGPAIFAYGYLCARSQGFVPDVRPAIALHLSEADTIHSPVDTVHLSVSASENTYKVEYYYEWHYVGSSTDKANGFQYNWSPDLPKGKYQITGKAYNVKGLPSLPTPAGETTVNVIRVAAGVGAIDKTPQSFTLSQNFPNPFNPSTLIRYALPRDEQVRLEVYDTLGRQVMTLVDEQQQAAYHDVVFKPVYMASGVYFYRLQAGAFMANRKMLLIR